MNQDLEQKIQAKGKEIFSNMKTKTSLFNKDWWYGKVMDWSMKNADFKTQMFRFVDVLPTLETPDEVSRHLNEYFSEGGNMPSIFNMGVGVGKLAPGLMSATVKKNITEMSKMFITGETPEKALPKIEKARKKNLCCTVDLLGEATLSETEAIEYQRRYIDLVEKLSEASKKWKPVAGETTDSPLVNVSVKITSLFSQIKEEAPDYSCKKILERLIPVIEAAKKRNAFINIDMESYSHKDLTLQVFSELIMMPAFKDYAHLGIVIQAYLKDAHQDVENLLKLAKDRGTPFSVRLVKGAYWDFEVIHADQNNWEIPVYTRKEESDINFEKCCDLILKSAPLINLAVASHNVRSLAAAKVLAEKYNAENYLEFQMLYGMAEPIKNSLLGMGVRVREYATVGELIPGMAYLVRRLLENTSNQSFLKSKFVDKKEADTLLSSPVHSLNTNPPSFEKSKKEFYNEALLDFAKKEDRELFEDGFNQLSLPYNCLPIINGEKLTSNTAIERHNPSNTDELIGTIQLASTDMADKAVASAKKAFASWRKLSHIERASYLYKLADLMKRDRAKLSALMVKEVGKPWKEADGDVCEAIDFCRYYADEAVKLNDGQSIGITMGEHNKYIYTARGVSLVISPWNFPLAILAGMAAASLVMGNTVIMKPAEQSSCIALELMQLFLETGIPKEVIHYLPAEGHTVGAHLVSHKDIGLIAFTGSKEVGLKIVKESAKVLPGQHYVKRCIIEMGGKNALIIDSDADLDEAVAGTIYSAFGFQGQKCSACSRVIVLEEVFDKFTDRLVSATKSIKLSNSEDPSAFLGPVVDNEAAAKNKAMIETAKKESKLLYAGTTPDKKGHYIAPHIFHTENNESELAQNEVFGPVLAVFKVKTFEEAIALANSTEFALTGGIYSRSPSRIKQAQLEVEVGNFYINRSITGAMVNRHPFGGFKMSGLGSKTGGPDYLKQFADPKVITENTMRRGFSPETV